MDKKHLGMFCLYFLYVLWLIMQVLDGPNLFGI